MSLRRGCRERLRRAEKLPRVSPRLIGEMLDLLDKIALQRARFKLGLQVVGHVLQRRLAIALLSKPDGVGKQEVVDAEPCPLGDMDELMKVQSVVFAVAPDEDRVLEGDPLEIHVMQRGKFGQAKALYGRKGHVIDQHDATALEELRGKTRCQPSGAERADRLGGRLVSGEKTIYPRPCLRQRLV